MIFLEDVRYYGASKQQQQPDISFSQSVPPSPSLSTELTPVGILDREYAGLKLKWWLLIGGVAMVMLVMVASMGDEDEDIGRGEFHAGTTVIKVS